MRIHGSAHALMTPLLAALTYSEIFSGVQVRLLTYLIQQRLASGQPNMCTMQKVQIVYPAPILEFILTPVSTQ